MQSKFQVFFSFFFSPFFSSSLRKLGENTRRNNSRLRVNKYRAVKYKVKTWNSSSGACVAHGICSCWWFRVLRLWLASKTHGHMLYAMLCPDARCAVQFRSVDHTSHTFFTFHTFSTPVIILCQFSFKFLEIVYICFIFFLASHVESRRAHSFNDTHVLKKSLFSKLHWCQKWDTSLDDGPETWFVDWILTNNRGAIHSKWFQLISWVFSDDFEGFIVILNDSRWFFSRSKMFSLSDFNSELEIDHRKSLKIWLTHYFVWWNNSSSN